MNLETHGRRHQKQHGLFEHQTQKTQKTHTRTDFRSDNFQVLCKLGAKLEKLNKPKVMLKLQYVKNYTRAPFTSGVAIKNKYDALKPWRD